ncbi:MAG: L-lactate dehydrogenase [Tenericutes bacterium]|nr:L-lactate dehydrogenase [Mycoplasmatota bacterium]
MNNKVVLVGCGNVGMAYAYSLINQKTYVSELVLIDINKEKASGEAMDLNHCTQFAGSKIKVTVGDYRDCSDAKIVVIAAGSNQEVGETRMDLIHKNSKIFASIVDSVMASGFNGIFVVATNPLDVMTYITLKYSKLPANKVIGSGTTLDTARLRYILSEKVGVNTGNIEAYVIGEHGDSEFIPWSNASIALKNINEFLTNEEMNSIEEEVRNSAYEIIKKKGATAYGIGICLTSITSAILEDKNVVLTVSSYDKENGICISTPAIVNKDGVKEKLFIPLNSEEKNKLVNSINIIKDAINNL